MFSRFTRGVKLGGVVDLSQVGMVRKFTSKCIGEWENGRLVLREDLKCVIWRRREVDKELLKEQQGLLEELEKTLSSLSKEDDEYGEVIGQIRKLDREMSFNLTTEFMDKNFYIQFNDLGEVNQAIGLMEDRQADRLDQALYVIGMPITNVDLEEPITDTRPVYSWSWVLNPDRVK